MKSPEENARDVERLTRDLVKTDSSNEILAMLRELNDFGQQLKLVMDATAKEETEWKSSFKPKKKGKKPSTSGKKP